MANKIRWTDTEIEKLKIMLESGVSRTEISRELGRTKKSIDCKIDKLHLRRDDYRKKKIRQNYYPVDVVCPFFDSMSKNNSKCKKICCEGINNHSNIILQFKSESEWKKHLKTFCNNEWELCLISIILNQKY